MNQEVCRMNTHSYFSEVDFSTHYRKHYDGSGHSYGEVLPAYRYGWDRAHESTYRGHSWNDAIDVSLENRWSRNSRLAWQEARAAIQEGYECAQISLSGPPGSIGPAPEEAALTLDEAEHE
jgi:hypothetical protein